MNTNQENWLRPSSLPKLEACPAYESTGGTSDAAERGTRIDVALRNMLAGDKIPAEFNEEDKESTLWAYRQIKEIANGEKILSSEDDCRMPSGVHGVKDGTADAIIPSRDILIDLKTGQIRDYKAQMAAYALSCMDIYFVDEWTTYLIFADQQTITANQFSRESAEEICKNILKSCENKTESICDYCGWCAKTRTCSLRNEMLDKLMTIAAELPTLTPALKSVLPAQAATKAPMLEEILADDGRAIAFLDMFKVAESYHDIIKAELTKRLVKGENIEGLALVSNSGRSSIPIDVIEHNIQATGFGAVFAAYGNLSENKYRKIWEDKCGNKPFPEDKIIKGAGFTYIKRSAKKQTKQIEK